MGDDLVVLWRDHVATHRICYEIVQTGEGEFELRTLCDGQLLLTEEAEDFHELIDRARNLRADLHARPRERAVRRSKRPVARASKRPVARASKRGSRS